MPDKPYVSNLNIQALIDQLSPKLTDQELEARFNTTAKGRFPMPGQRFPVPGHPYPYGKQLDIHDPAVNKAAVEVLRQFPGVQDRINRVVAVPNRSLLDNAYGFHIDPADFEALGVSGQWDARDKSVYINPKDSHDSLIETVAHELAHVMGADEDRAMSVNKTILGYLRGPGKK